MAAGLLWGRGVRRTRDREIFRTKGGARRSFLNIVTVKPNDMMAKTRFKEPSANLEMAKVLLVLNGSAMGCSRGWKCCAAAAVLGYAAADISGLLG